MSSFGFSSLLIHSSFDRHTAWRHTSVSGNLANSKSISGNIDRGPAERRANKSRRWWSSAGKLARAIVDESKKARHGAGGKTVFRRDWLVVVWFRRIFSRMERETVKTRSRNGTDNRIVIESKIHFTRNLIIPMGSSYRQLKCQFRYRFSRCRLFIYGCRIGSSAVIKIRENKYKSLDWFEPIIYKVL